MTKPKIFISSTVHDFLDLRSALKDYLEGRGCTVLASEYSDFPKGHNQHSYEECLSAIDHSDIFLLLVGKRVGGWYDFQKKISITHAEFNHAVERVNQGKLKIITFVRQDAWNHRRSVKELEKTLKSKDEIDPDTKKELLGHQTETMENPEVTIAFLDAIARNKETADASRGVGTAPLANWIHTFSTFTEIRQAIDPLILGGLPVRIAAGRKALETQILAVLGDLLTMGEDGILFNESKILNIVSNLSITSSQYFNKSIISLEESQFSLIFSMSLICCRASCDPAPLSHQLTSDLLFKYDQVSGMYHTSDEYDLLLYLVNQMRSFVQTSPGRFGDMLAIQQKRQSRTTVSVPADLIAAELTRGLRWLGAVTAARSLALSLSGGPFIRPLALPKTVLVDQKEDVAADEVPLDAVRAFVRALIPSS